MTEGEPITAEGLQTLKADLERLETEGRREIAARIQSARELGDLSENAEYHIAKEDQAHLETKILRLRERLRKAVVVESGGAGGVVAFGSQVEVVDTETGRSQTWAIVGSTEADATAGRLSAESPVARALIGHGAGDTVEVATPRGARKLRIERVGG